MNWTVRIVPHAVFVALVALASLMLWGCAGQRTVKAIEPPSGIEPAKFGAGTIFILSNGSADALLFSVSEYGVAEKELLDEAEMGTVAASEVEDARFRAATDLLQFAGISPSASVELIQKNGVSARKITKRYLRSGNLMRHIAANKIKMDVVRALSQNDRQITTIDFVVEGLVVVIERDALANFSVELKSLEAAADRKPTEGTSVRVERTKSSGFQLSATAPLAIGMRPRICSEFTRDLHLDAELVMQQRITALEKENTALADWKADALAVLNRPVQSRGRIGAARYEANKRKDLATLNRLFTRVPNLNDEILDGVLKNDRP
jgi:hypothetical protein